MTQGGFILAAGVGAVLAAQPLDHTRIERQTITPADMRHIEAVRRDRNPLAHIGRVAPAGLRLPQDFKSVYQVPDDASNRYGGWFARPSGAVIAAFPRGQYELITYKDKRRKPVIIPIVAPGTIYFLGGIPRTIFDLPTQHSPAYEGTISGYVDSAVDLAAGGAAPDGFVSLRVDETVARPARDQSIPTAAAADPAERLRQATLRTFSDPAYRNRRVDAMFMLAAQESGRSPE